MRNFANMSSDGYSDYYYYYFDSDVDSDVDSDFDSDSRSIAALRPCNARLKRHGRVSVERGSG